MDYSLDIVSESDETKGFVFKSYNILGEYIIGAKRSEPFAVRFKNNTFNRVQVRISLDGTDVISGAEATTKPIGKMWIVDAKSELYLKCWPETNNGGAKFVFTTKNKGVAVNTHGVAVGIGIIAAAIYVDAEPTKYFNPLVINPIVINPSVIYPKPYTPWPDYSPYPIWGSQWYYGNSSNTGGGTFSSNAATFKSAEVHDGQATMDSCSLNAVADNLSVGAGEYTEQKVSTATGLNKPVLDEILQIRYVPHAKLSKLIAKQKPVQQTSSNAFPADPPEKRVNLKGVPRTKISKKVKVEIQRFV